MPVRSLTLCLWLTGRMGLEPILPVKLSVTISTMLNFDGECDGDGHSVGMCKQTLIMSQIGADDVVAVAQCEHFHWVLPLSPTGKYQPGLLVHLIRLSLAGGVGPGQQFLARQGQGDQQFMAGEGWINSSWSWERVELGQQ